MKRFCAEQVMDCRIVQSSGIPLKRFSIGLARWRKPMNLSKIFTALLTAAVLVIGSAQSRADSLTERAAAGKPIRIGFAHEIPWAYPGDNNEPLGFANALALGVLKSMGYTNIEPVVTDWG